MNFYIHIPTNLEFFRLLNEGWLLPLWGKKEKEIDAFFDTYFPWELKEKLSPIYEVHRESGRELRRKFWQDIFKKIDGIYYGSDNCEYLLPYLHEIKEAWALWKEFNRIYPPHKKRTFVLVTPYVWDTMLWYLEETLAYLHDFAQTHPIEVVVNDYGVLHLIQKKYTKFSLIFWRLLHKLLKTPLIDTYGYEVHPAGESIRNKDIFEIETIRKAIIDNQKNFYQSASGMLSWYQQYLKKMGVKRISLDFMEKRSSLFDSKKYGDISLDVYYPWALVFTGRLCDTSGIEFHSRKYYAIDTICNRVCKNYDIFYPVKTTGYYLLQRGNACFRSEIHLDYLPDDFFSQKENRFIYAPFIPV